MKKIIIVLLLIPPCVYAQILVPFTSDQWKFETKDHAAETYQGKESVRLKENMATLPAVSFENGIIEYDLAFPQGRAFIRVSFRMQDNANYEEFYVRTHQSGNPDANQYSPVYGGLAAWQLYYGEGYSTPIQYAFNEWIHVKLMISGQRMDVYINDMETPLIVSELKRPSRKGYLGLSSTGENHFANFTYTPMDKVPLKGTPKPKEPAPQGTITQWEVSSAMPAKSLAATTMLKSLDKTGISWKSAGTENTGLLNLASVATWSKENNTVLAKVIVNSDKNQVKKFVFGFSEHARVYLNDNLLYSGEDDYRSRDYRFLGTLGYYDAVYLNLKKGRNEITIAVTETLGGWGVKGKFEEVEGISFQK
jgi:hypothetical protein